MNSVQNNQPNLNIKPMEQSPQLGGKTTIFTPLFNGIGYINHHVMYLNNSKFFAGVIMILLNIGSKFITIQFSKSTEEYMKYSVTKQLLVFERRVSVVNWLSSGLMTEWSKDQPPLTTLPRFINLFLYSVEIQT